MKNFIVPKTIFADKYQNTPSPRDDHSLETLKRHEKRKIFKKKKYAISIQLKKSVFYL